jgi:hypothetical protein
LAGPTPHGFTWDLVLLKDLSKTSKTDRLGQHLSQTSVKPGQTWSSLVNLREMHPRPRLEVILMWWVRVRSDWLSLGYLVLRADTRANLGGKNRVMTALKGAHFQGRKTGLQAS